MRTNGPTGPRAHLLAAAASSAASDRASAPRPAVAGIERIGKRRAHAGDVVAWHDFATALVARLGLDDLMASQRLAVAVHAQMNALAVTAPEPGSVANAAIARVLATYFPGEATSIHAFARKLGLPGDVASQTIATVIAERSLAARAGDGTTDDRPIALPEGKWAPKDPSVPPLRPRWGAVRMWSAANVTISAPPPPAEGSEVFTHSYKLSRNSYDVRSILETAAPAKRKAVARAWVAQTKEWEHQTPWNDALVAEIKAHNLSPQATAKLLFAYHAARADAYVAVWKAKYDPVHGFVRRPWQIEPHDPIKEAVALPNAPSYPSGHAGQGGAISAILSQVFPEKKAQWRSMAAEARASRIIGGLSYLFDSASAEMGRKAAVNVMKDVGIIAS